MDTIGKRCGSIATPGALVALMLAVAAAAAGCAATPVVRRMAPYPAQGQSEAQRAVDMSECEAWATAEATQAAVGRNAGAKTLGGALVGGALGAATGAATGAAAGGSGPGAGAGAAIGATIGAISGALSAGVGEAVADQQTVAVGWRNCMIAHGYTVEGGMAPVATNDIGTFGGAVGAASGLW